MPAWLWFVLGCCTGGLAFWVWLAWYFKDSFR